MLGTKKFIQSWNTFKWSSRVKLRRVQFAQTDPDSRVRDEFFLESGESKILAVKEAFSKEIRVREVLFYFWF